MQWQKHFKLQQNKVAEKDILERIFTKNTWPDVWNNLMFQAVFFFFFVARSDIQNI